IMIGEVIRKSIGFAGALMSDDISMGALNGTIGERTWAAIAAGCDLVLHCNGRLDEMQAVGQEAPMLPGPARKRTDAALAAPHQPDAINLAAARKRFAELLARDASDVRMVVS